MNDNFFGSNSLEIKSSMDNMTVLVIDDDKWTHRVLNKYLTVWGFGCITALDGFEGVALAIKHKPVLVILDVVMPELQGHHVLKLLKKIEETAEIPVIMISANFQPELLAESYRNGASAFISKPYSEELLYEKVRSCLSPNILDKLKNESFRLSY